MESRILSARLVRDGYIKIRIVTLANDGGEPHEREVEDHGRAACVLPYDPARRLALLVRLPRAPVLLSGEPEQLWEAPAGMIDAGESAETAAFREAKEEAGLDLSALELIAEAWPSPGVSAERCSLFLAPYGEADRQGPGGGLASENEAITVCEVPLGELWAMAQAGRLTDLKTLTLTLALKVRRPELFGA